MLQLHLRLQPGQRQHENRRRRTQLLSPHRRRPRRSPRLHVGDWPNQPEPIPHNQWLIVQRKGSTSMTTRATCTFEITAWEPVEYDEKDGVKLTRTHVAKAFHGD